MITHHLTESLLSAYSAGTLPEAYSLAVATHVSLCDECRAQLESFDSLGGALLETVDSVATEGDSLAATMARIRSAGPAPRREPVRPTGLFPAPLADYLGQADSIDGVRWRSIGGGVRQAMLPTSRGATARLLRIPGGVEVPEHGHRGLELTLVLQGSFSDADGRFARGDIEVADQSLEHTPIADPGEDCICLAVTDAPLRFNSLVPRILQPFLRI